MPDELHAVRIDPEVRLPGLDALLGALVDDPLDLVVPRAPLDDAESRIVVDEDDQEHRLLMRPEARCELLHVTRHPVRGGERCGLPRPHVVRDVHLQGLQRRLDLQIVLAHLEVELRIPQEPLPLDRAEPDHILEGALAQIVLHVPVGGVLVDPDPALLRILGAVKADRLHGVRGLPLRIVRPGQQARPAVEYDVPDPAGGWAMADRLLAIDADDHRVDAAPPDDDPLYQRLRELEPAHGLEILLPVRLSMSMTRQVALPLPDAMPVRAPSR